MAVNLSMACTDSDIVEPLIAGKVNPEGINLDALTSHPSKRHKRFFEHQLYDVCEVSLASYISSRTEPEKYRFTAIPVFPSRMFRHSFVYKHESSDIETLAELAGKKVATQSWQTTATVWLRGIAREHYGLDLEDVTWYRRREDDVPIQIPERFEVKRLPGKKEGDAAHRSPVKEALFSGDLDVVMDPSGSLFNEVVASDAADFLFSDPKAEELEYYQETGIHPIMHVVVIRDSVLEENPWVAPRIYESFCEAKNESIQRNRSPSRHMSLTWSHLNQLEQQRLMGPPEEVWEYGLTPKTKNELNTFLEYSVNQGLIPKQYDLDELFVDSTLGI